MRLSNRQKKNTKSEKIPNTFDEYVLKITSDALSTKHYDPQGNSALAIYNRGPIQSVIFHGKNLFLDMRYVISKGVFHITLGEVLNLIIATTLFPAVTLLRTFLTKRSIRAELENQWQDEYLRHLSEQSECTNIVRGENSSQRDIEQQ